MAIDDKVVAISFESGRFESGINRAIAALEKLKASLHFPTAGKGLDDISTAAKKVDLSHIEQGVSGIKRALESLRLVAIGVMSQLATQATRAAGRFIKAFTLDPIKAGFSEYTTNLNAVQTILANTQAAGVGLKKVNATLKELNEYSDKTIYNFAQMAKNIGTFTAAGVDIDTATASIKGIANLAALSGSNAEQASTAMYQLSQAIAAGRVSLMDWNSVVNAGMGGTVFQRALAQTAEAMGTLEKGAVKLEGPMKNVSIHGESFRNSIAAGPGKESWLTSDVLTATLKQFTGDLSNAELAAMGFNKAQIAAIQQTAKTAMHAATEVKTLEGVLSTAKETAQSGWAETWQIIFGDFAEAKTLFTGISNAVNGFISDSAEARNKVLSDWKALGGRTVLINSIKTAFQNLGLILKPIKDAFRDIFPAKTGKDLYDLTLRFQDFARSLKPSEETVANLRRTFAGLFAVFSIIGQVISGVFTMFGKLFGVISDGSGGFLELTGGIGDFLVSVDAALKKGNRLHNFFADLGAILAVPLKILKQLANAIGDLFSGFSSGGFSGQIEGVTSALTPFQRIVEGISIAWDNFIASVKESGVLQAAFDGLIQFLQNIGPAIGKAASSMNFEAILAVIRTGLFGGLVLMLKNFFGKGSFLDQISKGFAGGIIQNIAGSFKALEGSMVAFQTNIKAKTLKEIAIAIALLAASVVALSFVDPAKLNKALVGIGVMMGELLGAMAILDKVGKSAGFIRLPFIAASLVILAGAIGILTLSVLALSLLNWNELAKGLTGVGALLAGVSAASIPLSANAAGMIRAGIGITAIAIGMNILALAVRQLSGLNMAELGKGLGGVGAGLVIVAGAMQAMPKGIILQGAALIAIAVALKILASAIEQFGGMDWISIGKGLAGIGGALLIIAGAMHLMPKGMVLQAAALLILSVALGKIAEAVQSMGEMSLGEIARGLGTLAGALVILAGALYLMSGALAGAAALTVAAAGISLLAGALVKMGGMSWGEILKSLIVLAGALTVIGVAGLLLAPVVPALLGLGAALLLIGAGLALAGAGIALIGVGLSAIAVAGPAAIGILIAAFTQFQQAIIENAKLLVLGILEIVQAFAATAPQFVAAIVKILSSVIDGIIQLTPKIGEAFNTIIPMILGVIAANQGQIIQAGFNLILALLAGIKNNIPALVTAVADIIVRFLGALSSNMGRIITAGTQFLTSFVKGIISVVPTVATAALDIVAKFISTIGSNLGKIATAGLQLLTRFLKAIASNLGDVIKAGTDVIVAMVTGIGNAGERIVRAARQAAGKFILTLASEIVKLADQVFQAMINLMNGLARVIENRSPEMRGAAARVGIAIIHGLTDGVLGAAGDLYGAIQGVMDKAMSLVKKIPLVSSPSKVTMEVGKEIINGLIEGIDDTAAELYGTVTTVSTRVVKEFATVLSAKTFRELAMFAGKEFAQGLKGTSEEIRAVFAEMNKKLLEQMATTRKVIAEEQQKLKQLTASGASISEIRKVQAVIRENEALLGRATAAQKLWTTSLRDERAELLRVVNEFERLGEKLKAAKEKLADLKRERDEAIKSYTEQYSQLPEVSELMTEQIAEANQRIAEAQANLSEAMQAGAGDIEKIAAAQRAVLEAEQAKADLLEGKILNTAGTQIDLVATYIEKLKQQVAATAKYRETLAALREMGLDDETYRQLLAMGTVGQEFADQLLAGGETAVESVGQLQEDLEAEAKALGVAAGNELYQAGIDSAQGLINGLLSQRGAARRAAEELADEMIDAINRKFRNRSPSKVFEEIGKFAMMGLAKGFTDSSKIVTDAVDNAAQRALTSMQKSMRRISDVVTNELNPNPVITPILDLTQVRSQAAELGALTRVTPIAAATSYGQAALISSLQTTGVEEEGAVIPGRNSFNFEQNNYSPKALTEIEIYRQTKNQLSQLKSVLSIT